jgi:hypothetical protein
MQLSAPTCPSRRELRPGDQDVELDAALRAGRDVLQDSSSTTASSPTAECLDHRNSRRRRRVNEDGAINCLDVLAAFDYRPPTGQPGFLPTADMTATA